MNPVLEGQCICGNSDTSRFWVLRSPHNDEEVWGVCCKKRKCHTEYLIDQFHTDVDAEEDADGEEGEDGQEVTGREETDQGEDEQGHQISWNGVQLTQTSPLRPQSNHGFQASLQRVPLRRIQQLREGDQIIWSRKYCIWHHGIVTKVSNANFEVVHWLNVTKIKMKIVTTVLTERDLDRAFKIDYSEVYAQTDDRRDLVVSRAYSRLHSDTNEPSVMRLIKIKGEYDYDYALLNANCEHFANYCTQGSESCYQSFYAVKEIVNTLTANTSRKVLKTAVIVTAEAVENVTHSSEIVGSAAVIFVESSHLIISMLLLRKLYKKGLVSRKVYMHEVVKHFTGSVAAIAAGVLVGFLAAPTPLLEIFLTPMAALVVKFVGMQLGSELGFWITEKYIERDERVVPEISQLQRGDHIVKRRFGGIIRTHGIFVALGEREGFIIVILFKKKSIVKLEIKFSGIRRVMYNNDEELAEPDDVISTAESLINDHAPRVDSRKRQVSSCKLRLEVEELQQLV